MKSAIALFLSCLAAGLAAVAGEAARLESSNSIRVGQQNGRWLFLTPEGRGFVALGVNHTGLLKTKDTTLLRYEDTAWFKRHGRNWGPVYQEIAGLCRQWGFNCAGYDAPVELWDALYFGQGVPTGIAASFYHEQLKYADVFDPAFAVQFEERARSVAAGVSSHKNFLGFFTTDCIRWDLDQARRSHGTDWISWLRTLDPGQPGRRRYAEFLRERYQDDVRRWGEAYSLAAPDFHALAAIDFSRLDRNRPGVRADDLAFLQIIARQYFQTIGATLRKVAPGAIIFGDKFTLRDCPENVLREAAPWIDVLAIQLGDHHHPVPLPLKRPDETWFDAGEFDRLHQLTGKPILICDHQCGFFDPETPQTGFWHQYPSAAEAADSYDKLLRAAFAKPYIVGYFRCQLISAWVEKARHYKQGILKPNGEPFDDYAGRIAKVNRDIIAELSNRSPSPPAGATNSLAPKSKPRGR